MEPFSMSQLFQGHDVTPVQALSKIVLAGARSVALATQMIAFVGDIRKHHPEVANNLETLSNAVLADWGLSANPKKADPAPTPAAPATPAKPPESLSWPPKPPVLADVYTENFYHVREPTKGRDDVLGVVGDEALELEPDMKLRFTGTARWEEGVGWWLRVAMLSPTGSPLTTWVLHTRLKPGDEIPKAER